MQVAHLVGQQFLIQSLNGQLDIVHARQHVLQIGSQVSKQIIPLLSQDLLSIRQGILLLNQILPGAVLIGKVYPMSPSFEPTPPRSPSRCRGSSVRFYARDRTR